MEMKFEDLCKLAGGNHLLGILSDYTAQQLHDLQPGEISKIIMEREAGEREPFLNLTNAAKKLGVSIPKLKKEYNAHWSNYGGRTILFMPSVTKIEQEVAA